jgi:glyoxylase-like metal-dependent hydrolase (beta-lactamase superfamily II)
MTPIAESYQHLAPNVFAWSAYDPAVKTELSCCAYLHEDGLVFVDPIMLSEEAWRNLMIVGKPMAVFVTNGNHERACDLIRKRCRIPMVSPVEACHAMDLNPDAVFETDDKLYGLKPMAMPGGGPGETAFLSDDRVLILGDAVTNLEPGGLALLPDKYCQNPEANRRSVAKLADLDFEVAVFAHGRPLKQRAKDQMIGLFRSAAAA